METVLLIDSHSQKSGYWTGDAVPALETEIDTLWGIRQVVSRRYDSRISVAPWTIEVRVPESAL